MRDQRFRIDHAAIETLDLEQSVRFYHELLMMDINVRMEVDEGTPFHHESVQLGYGPSGSVVQLEIVRFFGDPPKAEDLLRLPRHIAIDVPNLKQIVDQVESFGGSVEVERMDAPGKLIQGIILDPDGNCLTLRQLLP